MKTLQRIALVVVLIASGLALASCGSDDSAAKDDQIAELEQQIDDLTAKLAAAEEAAAAAADEAANPQTDEGGDGESLGVADCADIEETSFGRLIGAISVANVDCDTATELLDVEEGPAGSGWTCELIERYEGGSTHRCTLDDQAIRFSLAD